MLRQGRYAGKPRVHPAVCGEQHPPISSAARCASRDLSMAMTEPTREPTGLSAWWKRPTRVAASLGVAAFAAFFVWSCGDDPVVPNPEDDPSGAPHPMQRFGEPPGATGEPSSWDERGFALRNDDVVVTVGATDMVRAEIHGGLEAALATAFAEQRPRFRPMAWDGDTVFEQKRYARFGTPAEQLAWIGADVVIAWFGKMEVLESGAGAGRFHFAYADYLEELARHTRRIVVLSPTPFESPASSLVPSHTERNGELERRVAEMGDMARRRGYLFVDLFGPLLGGERLTDDGLHLNERGLDRVTEVVVDALAPGTPTTPDPQLLDSIRTANLFWDACWRPTNWAFIYGDLTDRAFGKGTGEAPALARELEQYKEWIARAEERTHRIALGEDVAPVHETVTAQTRPAPPEQQRATFEVMEGYQVELFASEADGLIQPVDMAWDERGRLWVACTPTYPQLVPGRLPNDFILVCEDTDGDGRVDRTHRFAEGLHIPLGIALGDGGLYVCEFSRFLHLRDTDGDGRADQTEILAQGFGIEDSHETLSTPLWSPTGDLFMGQGNNIFSRVETPHGTVELQGGGFWVYRPRTRQFDGYMGFESAGLNPRTAAFNRDGQPFVISGGSGRGTHVRSGMVRGVRPKMTPRWLFDARSKGTGLCFVESSHFPDDMQGVAVIGGFIANAIELDRVREDGSSYATDNLPHLVKSSGPEFRVVDVSIGPDGALYALDLYSKVITHYRAPLRDPGRDKVHGRVWRITAVDRPLVRPPNLATMTAAQLIEQLGSREHWTRYQARRLLFGMPTAEVEKAGDAWLSASDGGATADPAALLELSGVYASHQRIRPQLLEVLLAHESPVHRGRAAELAGLWHDRLQNAPELLLRAARDQHPRVRLEATVAAAALRSPRAVEVVVAVLEQPRDAHLDHALNFTVRALEEHWRRDLDRPEPAIDWKPEDVAFLLAQSQRAGIPARVLSWLDELAGPQRAVLLEGVVRRGRSQDLPLVLRESEPSAALVDTLVEAAEQNALRPANPQAGVLAGRALERWLQLDDPAIRIGATRLVTAWRAETLLPRVEALALDRHTDPALRAACLVTLGQLRREAALETLRGIASDGDESDAVALGAIRGLLRFDLAEAARRAADRLHWTEDATVLVDILTAFCRRPNGGAALAEAVADVDLDRARREECARIMGERGLENLALLGQFHDTSGEHIGMPQFAPPLVKRLAAAAASSGDAERGRDLYRTKLATCATCHAIDDEGGRTGPALTHLGNNMDTAQIIESVLWPNRLIKSGYEALTLLRKDGTIAVGYRQDETKNYIDLLDYNSGETERVYKRTIERRLGTRSIMPQGLAAGLTEAEFADVVKYLAELGRGGGK